MDYSSVKKIPFKGYARAYETTDKRLFCDPESGKEVVTSKYIGTVKVTIEPDED